MNGNDELKDKARKALRLKQEAKPAPHGPEHRTSRRGGVSGGQVAPTDTAVAREPTNTPNLKRSHNARTGDA